MGYIIGLCADHSKLCCVAYVPNLMGDILETKQIS